MNFDKQASSIDDQVELLRARGMLIECDDHAKRCLSTIGYYRLSAYWLIYEEAPEANKTRSKNFHTDTNFNDVYKIYVFDRMLRVLLMEAIERVEIHIRSRWTNKMTLQYGPHAHLNHTLFSSSLKHSEQLFRLARAVERSNETFIEHYKRKYTFPDTPPLWAATELMTLGELSKWFSATKDNTIRDSVSRDLGLPTKETFEGTLQALAYVRNICAHHGRLWNRRFVKRIPRIKRMQDELVLETIKGQKQPVNLLYNILVVVLHLLKQQNTDVTFQDRLVELIETVNDTQRKAMGFPDNWRDRITWAKT